MLPKEHKKVFQAILNQRMLLMKTIEYNSFNKYYDRKDLLVRNELWGKLSNNNFSIVDLIKIFDNLGDIIKKEITFSLKEI